MKPLVPLVLSIPLLVLTTVSQPGQTEPPLPAAKESPTMKPEQASAFARLALKGIRKEYPNKPADVLNGEADVKSPRAMHPAFYGCFDWHSSVHGHWMLVRLLRLFPDLPERKEIRAALAENLTAKNLQAEADTFKKPNHKSFERTYGWAWLLKLAEELHGWDDPDGREWSRNLRPLADTIVDHYLAFLPKQTYPIRSGVHPNTAFGLAFALDYARAVEQQAAARIGRGAQPGLLRQGRGDSGGVGAGRGGLLLAEPDGSGPDAARAAGGRVPRLAAPLPAGPGEGRAEDAARAGEGDGPHRPADSSTSTA